MDRQQIFDAVVLTLQSIAPEVERDQLLPAAPLREQVDLDSMDWLNFLIGLHQRLQVDIPESDYASLATLDQIVAYLQAKLTERASGGAPF
jgi:acyl carrier protein